MRPKAIEVTPLKNYELKIMFDNGEIKIFDVKPYISGDWYGELSNIDLFNTVHPCGTTVEWAGGQDIAPHELYDLSVLA